MKKIYKLLIITAIVGLLGAAYGWFFIYNKPHADYASMKPIAIMDAQKCFNSFVENDPETANWLGKVIQISGTVHEIEMADSIAILVFVQNEDEMFGNSGIRCSMHPDFMVAAQNIAFPSQINIKGFCAGYNGSDLILDHCIIITDN